MTFAVSPASRASLLALFLAATPLVPVAPAVAAPVQKPGAELHLLDGGWRDGRPDLGLEIVLEPGWKTYWRTPGDAGIPPTLDASASRGVAALTPRFPAPIRFEEDGVRSIGYDRTVVLPLDVTLVAGGGDAVLDLSVQIGICRDICVPVSARLGGTIRAGAAGDAAAAARIAAARRAVPVPVDPKAGPRIVAIERRPGKPETIAVTVADPAGAPEAARDLLVEGPDEGWALPQPDPAPTLQSLPPAGGGPKTTVWEFQLDGAPAEADLAAGKLRFTLRAGDHAVEQTVGLDGSGVLP